MGKEDPVELDFILNVLCMTEGLYVNVLCFAQYNYYDVYRLMLNTTRKSNETVLTQRTSIHKLCKVLYNLAI